jgi:hypothetical protein
MTKKPAMRFLIGLVTFVWSGLRRLVERLARPGTGPFLAGG